MPSTASITHQTRAAASFNQALQLTAPGVTLAAADCPATFARSQRAAIRSR